MCKNTKERVQETKRGAFSRVTQRDWYCLVFFATLNRSAPRKHPSCRFRWIMGLRPFVDGLARLGQLRNCTTVVAAVGQAHEAFYGENKVGSAQC